MSVDHRIRCERAVPVVAHARHAYGMVHATTGRERLPPRIGAAVRTDGCRMVDVGIRTHGTSHTTSDRRTREENRQTSGGWMVQRDEDGLSVPRLFLPWLPVHSRRGERRQRETHGATARRDPKDHRLPTSLCQGRRAVGMRVERDETSPGRTKVSGCCISPTSTRAVDDDVATDPERRACRNRFRHDRVQHLRTGRIEMQPVFKNISLIREDLGPFMRRYAEEHNIMSTPRRMLVGSYRGDKILLATPLLRWYLDHGLEVLHVYQVIEYDPIPCFRRFGDAVSTARREGDVHRDKTIIADTMKLLGNSGYGKTITNVDRHRDVSYCTEKAASLMVNDKRFRQLDIVVDGVHRTSTRGILRSAVRQDAHVAVLLRLHHQIRGAPSVPVLRDGYR